MVRHGTQKKRRSGRKVTRKPQLAWGKRQKNAVRDPVMREQWNSNESIESNFSKAGIVSEVKNRYYMSGQFQRVEDEVKARCGGERAIGNEREIENSY